MVKPIAGPSDWELAGYVISSEGRFKALESLAERNYTPKQLATRLGIGLTHMSYTLTSLGRRGLVECLNPKSKKGRIYGITELGRRIFSLASKIRKP
jgi:DNA-binding MarR family transcriptional regulator